MPAALAASLLAVLFLPSTAGAMQSVPSSTAPTVFEARAAVRVAFGNYVATIDGARLIIAGCPRKGEASRVCRVGIRTSPRRKHIYRVVVTASSSTLTVSARDVTPGRSR